MFIQERCCRLLNYLDALSEGNKIRGVKNAYASFVAFCKQKLSEEIDDRYASNRLCKNTDFIL